VETGVLEMQLSDKVSVCTADYKLLNHNWGQEPHPGW